jgi:hypothetical protein
VCAYADEFERMKRILINFNEINMDLLLTILFVMAMVAIGAVLGSYLTFITLKDFVRRKITNTLREKK